MKVVFFHRKPYPGVNFSIENLFAYVRTALPEGIVAHVHQLRFFSRGILKRILISIEALLNQGDVNHITGDVHFIALFLRKSRTVLTIHDIGFMQHPHAIARSVLKLFWLSLPVRNVRLITTVSEATKMAVLQHVKIDPNRIEVVYDPVMPWFKKVVKSFDKVHPRILQIGTKPNKNIPRLVQAIRGLNAKLHIIGALNSDLISSLEASGIEYSNSVNLSDAEVFKEYVAADIVAFVSTNEGFGMPIVEANAVGRVVITSNISSMPEIAANSAHLVDPYDVVSIRNGFIKVIDDDDYRERLISNGYQNCKRFNVDEIARRYTLIYERLMDNH